MVVALLCTCLSFICLLVTPFYPSLLLKSHHSMPPLVTMTSETTVPWNCTSGSRGDTPLPFLEASSLEMLLAASLYEGCLAYRKENKFQKRWGMMGEGHEEITCIAPNTENTKSPYNLGLLLRISTL